MTSDSQAMEFADARKRAENDQQQMRLFRELLDRTNDLIYLADARNGRIVDCNATLPARLGYTAAEVRQLSVWDLSTAAGKPSDWEERVARVRKTGSLVIYSEYCRKDTSTFPVEISLSYVASEPYPLLIAITRDVTERKRQEERVARFTQLLKMQNAIHSALLRIREPDELFQEACRLATQIGGYDHAVTTLVDPVDGKLHPKYRAGIGGLPDPEGLSVDDDSGFRASTTGQALYSGEVTVCNDLGRDQPTLVARDVLLRLGVRSIVALPLRVEGVRLGVMTLFSGRSDPMSDEELMVMQDVAATLSLGLRSQQNADAAQFLTYYDPVSGLARRALFCERLNAIIEQQMTAVTPPVVAVFDVSDLSGFNDTYGRGFGDALLRAVAEKARVAADSELHLGHLGGGTFVLVARNVAGTTESAAALIDNTVFDQPFQIQGRSVRVACRSGLARYPDDGKDAATLIQKAEAALRQARESGERYLHFKLQMHSDVAKRLQLEHDLREAVDANQFVLHYQPQVSIATGRIEAVEALLRWRHPQGRMVLPAVFLPMLEASGLIVRVGAWVLSQAAADCRALLDRGLGPVRIAVNVSALQIRRRGFAEDVLKTVGNWHGGYGVDVEITESSILQDLEDTRRKLQKLRAEGIRIAIDDFGTGYSSLGLLSRLPLDILKIDRSFVSGLPGDRASVTLISSIIQIASGLGLVTVAEGVETASQLAILRSFSCTQSQGWLHYKAMPFADLMQLLEREAKQEVVAATQSPVDA